jgi:hypothetical protein
MRSAHILRSFSMFREAVYDFKVPMTTQTQFALYPVVLAPAWDDNPFDESQLPASILPGVTIENIKSHVPRDEFDHFQDYLSKRDIDALHNLNSSIVYRYDSDTSGEEHREAEAIVRNIAACLMLIRPTTKRMGFMRGQIRSDGTFKFESFDNPRDDVNVPMVQRLFAVRNGDLQRLQSVAEEFIAGDEWRVLEVQNPASVVRIRSFRASLLERQICTVVFGSGRHLHYPA